MSDGMPDYESAEEIEAVVRGFESCALPDSEFDHRAHLTVALSYLHLAQLTIEEATARMRAGLYRYLDYHGHDRQKYNETITLFWIKRVRSFLGGTDVTRPLPHLVNEMAAACGPAQLLFDYYSKEYVLSEKARQMWVEPDLKPLDF